MNFQFSKYLTSSFFHPEKLFLIALETNTYLVVDDIIFNYENLVTFETFERAQAEPIVNDRYLLLFPFVYLVKIIK